jgi:hypothetical protein
MLRIPLHDFFNIPLSILLPCHKSMSFRIFISSDVGQNKAFYFRRPTTQALIEERHHIGIVIAFAVLPLFPPSGLAAGLLL